MTTSNDITLDHINSFFSLDREVEPLNIAPTVTGGIGIDNLDKCPPPKPLVPQWRRVNEGAYDYVKKYRDKEEERLSQSAQFLSIGSSLHSLNDIEADSSVANAPAVSELDAEATHQIYSTYFQSSTKYDTDLTICSYRDEILQQLAINPVVIIQGPTGCGKTTQVPQYILDYHQSRGMYCNIIVTQPRKIAAISIARRVCQERNWQLGSIVGYQVAMDPRVSSDTRLSYVTTGVLLEKLVNAKRMDMYTHVIIDEVHERNQDIDFALLLVKKFLKTNSQTVKVILMSATFDSSEFAEYFSLTSERNPAPVIEIVGKSREVSEHYLPELSTLLPDGKIPEFKTESPMVHHCLFEAVIKLMIVFDKIEKAEQNVPKEKAFAPKRGAVLIFLPGYEEISSLSNSLRSTSISQNFWIIPLHSTITVDEQTKVFRNPGSEQRKVIISTNIAESSITVPDVKYVIDFCLTKNLVTDPCTNYTCLKLEWASKSNCIQRRGRAGRVDIGKVYRMVPRNFYNSLPDYNIPEIKRCPLTSTILHVKKLNLCEPIEMFAFALDPPAKEDIGFAILQLKEGLALTTQGHNDFDGDLTFIGCVMANLPLDIKLSKLIIFGYVFHCLEECIIIAASLSLSSFLVSPFDKHLEAYRSRLAWSDYTFSDCLVYLNAYKTWKQHTIQGFFKRPSGLTEKQWAHGHFIQIQRIKEVDMLIKEIKSRLENLKISVKNYRHDSPYNYDVLVLKMVIAGALFPNYFQQEPLDEDAINRVLNKNDPLSTVYVSNLPDKYGILYASALKDLLLPCNDNIEIEFEEKKAYIKFPRNTESNSAVVRSVYFAVKMGKLNMPLELSVFSEEEAERKNKQLMSSRNVGQIGLPSNRITVKYKKPMKSQDPDLPGVYQEIIKVLITHVKNCGQFYVQCMPKSSNDLRFLETTINSARGKNLKPLSKVPETDILCLAPYIHNNLKMYYRAQVKHIRETLVEVFFVDYGNTTRVPITELREISEETPDVLTTRFLAFECQLAEVKPSSLLSSAGDWCHEANTWFNREINGILLHAKVYSVVQNIVRVELLKQGSDNRHHSINKKLEVLGFAEPAEESLASKQNHDVRTVALEQKFQHYASNGQGFDANMEMSWAEAAECTAIRKTGRKIRLKGPYSPLEVSYSGLTLVDRSNCVNVESESVNSVSLNPDPQDTYCQLLVAAHIGVRERSGKLSARHTTLMPKLRGLPTLVCLIFSPFVEIRTDRERKSYTGALCGLGYKPETGEAIYDSHDIELPFDIDISLEDITEINAIRMGFNLLLSSESQTFEYATTSVGMIHERTREKLMSLLKKKREPVQPQFYPRPYQWNQIPPELILDALVESCADSPNVLPLHKPPSLASMTQNHDDSAEHRHLRDHLNELYQMVENPTKDHQIIRCRLCSEDVTSTRELLLHLDSRKHMSKEKEIKSKI